MTPRPAPSAGAPATAPVVEPAPAKLNLYLHVLGRRSDGYHLLDSLIAFASIADTVTVAPAEQSGLVVEGRFADAVPTGRDAGRNLAWQAVLSLAEALGRPAAAAVTLTKRLPVAAGIGGGSADAAAVLRALAELWGADDAVVARVAGELGADVPVCLAGRSAHVGGIGDRLEPAPSVAGTPLVLVNPGATLATPDVFASYRGGYSAAGRLAVAPRDAVELAALLAERRNDLTVPVRALVPEIGTVLAELAGAPGCLLARMSGSGATCFGLFRRDHEAAQAAAGLHTARPGWWVRSGRLV